MDSNNNHIQNLLDNFYKEYNTKLKPILALLEAEIQQFPINILNEVRAIHDHIARTYGDDLDLKQKEKQIELALRHINRAILDCYKIVVAVKDENIRKIIRNYRYTNLGEVDSGRFYPKFNKIWKDAKKMLKTQKLVRI